MKTRVTGITPMVFNNQQAIVAEITVCWKYKDKSNKKIASIEVIGVNSTGEVLVRTIELPKVKYDEFMGQHFRVPIVDTFTHVFINYSTNGSMCELFDMTLHNKMYTKEDTIEV